MTADTDQMLKNAKIASPCSSKWEEMRGDDKIRYCDACSLNVYNFASMTSEEVADLLHKAASGERVCASIYRRLDGKILTRDCPIGLRIAREAYSKARQSYSAILTVVAVILAGVMGKLAFERVVSQLRVVMSQAYSTLDQRSLGQMEYHHHKNDSTIR